MGKASAPKRGRAKARPLRSDSQPRPGMPTIALGKNSKKAKGKARAVIAKKDSKFKVVSQLKSAKPERRNAAPDGEAGTSKSPSDSPDSNSSKRQKASKASLDRAESPATTRLSRSSSSSSVAGKTPEATKTAKGKGKSPVISPSNKGILGFFKKLSPPSKGPTGNKKTLKKSKKELVPAPKKLNDSKVNSSPESIVSDSMPSNQVSSEGNDDDISVPDDAESCIESHDTQSSSSGSISKSVNGTVDSDEKTMPKLTKKNINELFPADDSTVRLRSGSPASQKSTRSLTILRSSPKASSVSSLRSTTRSDSAVRPLRNGLPNKLKRSSLFENLLDTSKRKKKKKRVYAGLVNKDEDKLDDSRSDISDEQSSIFSESDSSSFIDAFNRVKNSEMDTEDVAGSMSNDDEDMIERTDSPIIKSDGSKGKNVSDEHVEEKKKEILNHIQSDWDSDGENREEGGDACDQDSPFGESLSNSSMPQVNDKNSTKDAPIENTESSHSNIQDEQITDSSEQRADSSEQKEETELSPPNVSSEPAEKDKTSAVISSKKTSTDAVDQAQDSSNTDSNMPDPIVLKTSENKNVFEETVDFVAKKNTRIDFELLRRRTKRSMSFNTDVPEKSQSQRILSVEPSKLHGKPTLLWTVKAVREPIIPKTPKSPEKGLNKGDSQENRNVSAVKPMMESTQNDQVTVAPKVASEALLPSASFTVNSSSKENILVPSSPKQSPGKSPVRDSVGVTPKPTTISSKAASEIKGDGSVNGTLCKERSLVNSPKQSPQGNLDSTLAATVKQPLFDEHSSMTSKTATVASGDSFNSVISSATAVQPSMDESSMTSDPAAVPAVLKENGQSEESATERCSTPIDNPPALQRDLELTPERSTFDDGESFCLRLSPTPTKDERQLNISACSVTPPRENSSLAKPEQEDPKPLCQEEEKSESMDVGESLETALPEESEHVSNGKEKTNMDSESKQINEGNISKDIGTNGFSEETNENNLATAEPLGKQINEDGVTKKSKEDSLSKPETPSLQLIIKKKGPGRPRSHSADSSVAYVHEMWVVKNDKASPEAVTKEKNGCKSDGKENIPEDGLDGIGDSEMVTTLDPEKSREANVINNSSSSMTVECPNVQTKQPGLLSPRLEADVERLNLELNDIEKKRREITEEEQSPEKRAIKEWILSSLGLQSVSAAAAAATNRQSKRRSQDGFTPSSGRLKAVIKVPKDSKRDKKNKPLRMVFKNGKPNPGGLEEFSIAGRYPEYDPSVEYTALSDVTSHAASLNGPEFGATMDTSLPSDLDKPKIAANLVIPEKSSSFSIHPGRLCSDVCSYCFGKFGSLDTPCHVAQLKSRERQMKIMSVETHLALDSCLCDACIRYVDRKANCASSSKPQTSHRKDSKSKFEGSMATCSVTACQQPARHSLRKKWYIKIRKSVVKKCPIDLELAHQHLPLPLCPEHFSYLEYFMSCGLCKRRLSKSHMYNLSNTSEINICLEHDGIPARLSDKLFVCKLCRYYATLRLKHTGSNLSPNQREFFTSYRKRILLCHDIDVSEGEDDGGADPEIPGEEQEDNASVSGAASSSNSGSTEDNLPKGKRKRSGSNATPSTEADSADQPKKKSRGSDVSNKSKDKDKTEAGKGKGYEFPPILLSVTPTPSKGQKGGKAAKARPEADARAAEFIRKGMPPFFPGEDELPLHGNFQFQFDDEPSASRVWEKCTSTLQFDKDTKKLWQELQRPYGSQSSFLRHLVLMERYWRQGELVLAPHATAKATSYTRSVQNRLNAYGSTITVQQTPAPTPSEVASKAPVKAPMPTAKPLAPVEAVKALPAKPDMALALTGGTVLTAADAAAAVTAVHLVSSSPSGEAAPWQSRSAPGQAKPTAGQQAQQKALGKTKQKGKAVFKKRPAPPAPQTTPPPAPQPAPQPQTAAQLQPVIQMKTVAALQAPQSHQALQVSAVAAQAVKSPTPPAIRLFVKTPTSVQDGAATSKPQVAISTGHPIMSIPPVSVSSGVTITAEPPLKSPPEKQQSVLGKLQPILPKPSSGAVTSKSSSPVAVRINNSSSWDSSVSSTGRPQFMSLSSAPVVNLTRSISLTAVPSSPPSVPDLHPINSQNSRPNRSSSAVLPSSTTVTTSRASPSFVSIIPTSPSKSTYSKPAPQSLNMPASITPIYTSQSLPSPVSVTSSAASSNAPSPSPPAANSDSKSSTQQQGKVHVTAGGKSFSLTIQQFRKLQALRQQRQLEQKKTQIVKKVKERRTSSTATSAVAPKDDLEVVEVRDMPQSSLPTISAVCSGDQAKAMWNDETRNSESDSSVSISVEPVDLLCGSEIPVENLPKLPKALTVTQIRKESPPLPKAISSSGMSVTITRQKCQSPMTPQMSSPALDIFPS